MSISLLCAMVVTWLVALRRHGLFSFVTAGTFCFSVYSLPALFELVYPFGAARAHVQLIASSPAAVDATVLAWLVFCLTLAIPAVRNVSQFGSAHRDAHPDRAELLALVMAALLACIAGFIVIAVMDGPLFFLEAREEGSEGLVRMLWRWVNAFGLIAAVLARSWKAAAIFVTAAAIYFLSGDRTVVVITGCSLLVVAGRGHSWTLLLRPRLIVGIVALTVVGLLGKPLYMAAKLGSVELLGSVLSGGWFAGAVLAFEPFTTFNILELVIVHEFEVSVWTVIEGVLGQLLVIPSAFGVDANSFNLAFTQEFAPRLGYGIAGNFWAQGWAVAGPLGVAIYAFIYATALRLCDRAALTCSGASVVFCSLLGGLFAVYAHRNALDNLASFIRQIAIVVMVVWVVARTLKPFFRAGAGRSRSGAAESSDHYESGRAESCGP